MLSLRSIRMGQVLAQGETVPSARMMDENTGGHPNALPRRDCPQHNPDTCSGPQILRNSSTTSFVPHPKGDYRSSTEETSAKSGKESARPKVKLSKGDRCWAHANLLPPCVDHFPVPRYLLQRHIWGNHEAT